MSDHYTIERQDDPNPPSCPWTVFRNGQPIWHAPTEAAAKAQALKERFGADEVIA